MTDETPGMVELTATGARTDVDAAAELAATPRVIAAPDQPRLTAALPPGWQFVQRDLEAWEPSPRRPHGTIDVHDAPGFIAAIGQRTASIPGEPVIYCDESANALVAVLNDDHGDGAGWRDYRVELQLRPTPEWTHWRRADGKLVSQAEFAAHIEDGLTELVEPAPADMLEIAQTFTATVDAKFRSGARLSSGAQQFTYEEDVAAAAGSAGTIEVPNRLQIVVAPFYGASRFEVGAWLKFRLNRDKFSIGYKLDRPHEVERAAFSEIRAKVTTDLPSLTVVSGPAPSPTGALAR